MMAEAVRPKSKKKSSKSRKTKCAEPPPLTEQVEPISLLAATCSTASQPSLVSSRLSEDEVQSSAKNDTDVENTRQPETELLDSSSNILDERPKETAKPTKNGLIGDDVRESTNITHQAVCDVTPIEPGNFTAEPVNAEHQSTVKSTSYGDALRELSQVMAEQVSMPSYHPIPLQTKLASPVSRQASRSPLEGEATIVHRKIRHRESVTSDTTMRPFTEAQLCSLYCNGELEANDQRTEWFVQTHTHPEAHEFHELLSGYLRARTELVAATRAVEELKQSYAVKAAQVWRDEHRTAKAPAKCGDGTTVHGTYEYVKVVFSSEAAAELENVLRRLRALLHEDYVLHSYVAEMSRLQVESYLYRTIGGSAVLRDLPHNAPVQVHRSGQRPPSVTAKVEETQRCIGILFAFQRRAINDQQFVMDTRGWLQKLVAVVHRLGTFEDHLVLLNHVLRCPPGVCSWAANFVQVPFVLHSEGPYPIGGPFLDHCLTVLSTLLLPIRARETFLQQTRTSTTNESDREDDAAWVLVDSEGEEDEDPANRWIHWRENDLVALLNQVPLSSLFRHLLAVFNRDGVDYYDARHLTDQELLRIFAVATQLIQTLRSGFKTFALSRYRQFAKRLSQVVRHTVMHVTDHLQQFVVANQQHLPAHARDRLQTEYDQFFLRATYSIFSSDRLGAWQFMANLPYDCVSVRMLWRIVWLLHNDYREDVAEVEADLANVDCRAELSELHLHLKFEERLAAMPDNEVYYLLTAFANMAIARTVNDYELIVLVCGELFRISFLNERSKTMCYKWGRELLATIATKHPFVISVVLEATVANVDKLGKIAIYLFQELPLQLWMPTADDLNALSTLLNDHAPATSANQLCQAVLARLNWDLEGDRLFLDVSVHRRIALVLLEAYQRHVPFGKGGFISESLKQAASLAMAVRSYSSPEETFVVWAWEMAFTLRLHSSQLPPRIAATSSPLDIHQDPSLSNLLWCMQMRHPLAVYFAFAMTNLGHRQADFCQKMEVLQKVLDDQYYEAVVQILSHVIPLFFGSGYMLFGNKTFLGIIDTLLSCDLTYLKMAKNLLVSTFPGKILQTLASVIEHHMRSASAMNWSSTLVVTTWTEILTASGQWHRMESVQYLLDTIFKYCFLERDKSDVQRIISHKFVNESENKGAGSTITSFLSWVATGSGIPLTLVNRTTSSKYHWLAYGLLEIETQNEQQLQLWKHVLRELAVSPGATPDSALKRAAATAEVVAPPANHLPIYRWAVQALDLPNDHPLVPLFWQKFFFFYLQRAPVPGFFGSVGERFFANMSSDMPLLKRMKKRLEELASHHRKLAALSTEELAKEDAQRRSRGSNTAGASSSNWEAAYENESFHEKLTKLYRTLYLWLEEPRLHDSALQVEALPAEYDPQRLVLLLQNSQEPWMEFVNHELVARDRQVLTDAWTSRSTKRYRRALSSVRGGDDSGVGTRAIGELLKRVHSYDEPLPPPPLALWKPAIPEPPANLMEGASFALEVLRPHLAVLTGHAHTFSGRLSCHTGLDCAYMELLPQIYRNVETEVLVRVACHKGHSSFQLSSDSGCLGPANISLRFHEKKVIASALTKLDQNRADWLGAVNEALLGTPQNVCVASVFVETVISQLLNRFRFLSASRDPRASQIRETGLNVFYLVCGSMDTFTDSYPPARQFLSSCCEILGKELVSSHGDQCERLLQMITDAPRLSDHLAPHFCPIAADVDTFIRLYQRCTDELIDKGVELAFVVLNKFDIRAWLIAARPPLSDRVRFVNCVEQALFRLGQNPPPELFPVDELFRRHLCSTLLHQFPDLYREVFYFLFKGVDRSCLAPQVWYDVLNALVGEGAAQLSVTSSDEDIFQICKHFGETQELFSLQELQDTLENLGERFRTQRLASQENLVFTLFAKNKEYVKVIAIFLGLICQAYLVAIKKDASKSLPSSAIVHVWTVVRGAFAPWILPVEQQGKLHLPWVAGQEAQATPLVTVFASCVQYASKTLYSNCSVLALFLDTYAQELAIPDVKEHVLVVCHRAFIGAISWNTFWPDSESVELMTRVANQGLTECTSFLASVFVQIGWPQVIHDLVQRHLSGKSDEVVRTLTCLLHLHVRLAVEPASGQLEPMLQLLEAARTYPWHVIDERVYDGAVRLFLAHCRPACVLGDDAGGRAGDAAVLQLLQTVAEFVPGPAAGSAHPAKRVTYVRTCVQLLCECSTKHRQLLASRMELFKDVVSGLLVQIEVVLATGVNKLNMFEDGVSLTTEVFNVLNLATVVCLQDLAMKAMQDWIRAHPRSPILGACLRAVSICLASLAHMATLIEVIVDSHFSLQPEREALEAGWEFVHSVMLVPQLSQQALVTECLRSGNYLTLNALAGLLQLQCKTPEEEWDLLVSIIRWLEATKPCEENEHKLLLLWWRVLEGINRRASSLHSSQMVDVLWGLSVALTVLGEDKSSQGLLAAIGFGKKSALSHRMRLCARAVNAVTLLIVVGLDLRAASPDHGVRAQRARQAALALAALEQTKGNRQYSSLREHVDHAVHLTKRTSVTLRDLRDLVQYLVNALFVDQSCLKIICSSSS